jgi:hypothetical protein
VQHELRHRTIEPAVVERDRLGTPEPHVDAGVARRARVDERRRRIAR